jgi:thiol-disulfide isomerase/thioredoxin
MRLIPRSFVSVAVLLFLASPLIAQTHVDPLPNADDILTQARATATTQHKNVLLIFGASWCGPCHMFQHFLDDPANKPTLDKAFVIATLDAGELTTDTKHHDTPGAVALLAKLGGANVGIPYLVMLTPAGQTIVTSIRPDPSATAGGNIGYPSTPAEIAWFMQMLQKAAPTLTPQDTSTLHAWLVAHGS